MAVFKFNQASELCAEQTEMGESGMSLIIGNKYKWKHEDPILTYIGSKSGWHQFTLNNELWCEVQQSDLWLMEEVK